MYSYQTSARITRYAARLVGGVMLALLLGFPQLVEGYHQHFRPLQSAERTAIVAGFYSCSAPVLLALWNMDRLLGNILRHRLFTLENVSHIRAVRWCCLAVSVICLAASFGFPSLVFLGLIMGFLCMAVTVVGQVLKAAVAIREENDLTV